MDETARIAAGHSPWRHHLVRTGRLELATGGLLRLVTEDAAEGAYSDAQIDDYGPPPERRFIRRPPLRLSVRARFSHEAGTLKGTAGFGFWNYPIALPLGLPRAIWFFYGSAPGALPLALDVPGADCLKAATVDTGRPRALVLAPLAPVVIPLLWSPLLFRGLWPPIQRAVGIAEARVRQPLTEWHEYVIEWGVQTSRFRVDGRVVLDEAPSPRGPLCFVAWIDNQYLVVTPQGHFRWGVLATPGRQWLELSNLVLS